MTGLISGDPVDSLTLAAQGSDAVQASTGEVLGAELGSAFNANPFQRILAAQRRGQMQWQDEAVHFTPPEEAPAMLAPDDANRQYGIKGQLNFDQPVSQTTASALFDMKHTEILRQDTIDRRGNGLLTSGAARLGVDFAAGLLDPLNLASAFIPVVGEGRMAAMLAGAGGGFGRAGIRAGIGAAQGAVGQAALEPVNYLLDTQEHQDWTAAQAMRNIAFGALLGGGLHVVGGAVADRITGRYTDAITQRMEDLGPEAREATLGGAVAQTFEGRPVDVAPAVDLFEARQAQNTLQSWHDRQERILADAEAARQAARVPGAPDLSGEIDSTSRQLAQTREQAAQLRAEIADTQGRSVLHAMDPETAARLADVQAELSGVIPSTRRASLEAERTMLLEGRGTLDVGGSADLDVQRDLAQARGLGLDLERTERAAADSEAALAKLRDADAAAQVEAEARRNSADRSLRVQQALIDSRQEVTQALAERSVRQYARQIGVYLEPGEAASFAREIIGAQPAEAADTIANALNSIAGRSQRADVREAVQALQRVPDAGDALRTEADGAARDLTASARRPTMDPDDATASRLAEEARTLAPAKPGVAAIPAEEISSLESYIKAAREAGVLDAADEAVLREADARLAEGGDLNNAYQQAAACLLRGNG